MGNGKENFFSYYPLTHSYSKSYAFSEMASKSLFSFTNRTGG